MDIEVVSVPLFEDNYAYLLVHGKTPPRAIVVDPGECEGVWQAVEARGCELEAILVTHHHWDHVAGLEDLWRMKNVEVLCSREDAGRVARASRGLRDGEIVRFEGLAIEALHVPGHTLGHMAYRCGDALFCGDTLFLGGCGRLFEGTAEQLYESLYEKILKLPEETRIYPGHEYTVKNRAFCTTIEGSNAALQVRLKEATELRARGSSTIPGTLAVEKATNVFLRCHCAAVIESVRKRYPDLPPDPVSVFAKLRELRNAYSG
ncbi:MAG: hydroxyacylglutathione hydrolase [bacterium]